MDVVNIKKAFDYMVSRIINKTNDEIPNEISLEYYTFCQNFTKYLGIDPSSELSNYRDQALEYLSKTFPYSFMKIDNKSVKAIAILDKNLAEEIKKNLTNCSLGGNFEQSRK